MGVLVVKIQRSQRGLSVHVSILTLDLNVKRVSIYNDLVQPSVNSL